MESNEKTKYKMADSIKYLMETTPLDKITVKSIVEHCGMTRQTFYRNFQDKYDLVNWYFEKLAQKSFKQMGIQCTLREGLIRKFECIAEDGCFFSAAFQSQDHNSLVEYDYECILKFYTDIIMKKTGKKLEEDIEFLLKMYCRASVTMTIEWATTGRKKSPEKLTDLLIEAMPDRLMDLLCDLSFAQREPVVAI